MPFNTNRQGSSSVQLIIVVVIVAGIAVFGFNSVLGKSGGAGDASTQTKNLSTNASAVSDESNAAAIESIIQTARLSDTLDANADGKVGPAEVREAVISGGIDVLSTREGFEFYIDLATDDVVVAEVAPTGYIQIP